jgi:Glycosyl hydrolases family 2, sugar binding domain/Glycosyl hydrolases family 2/Glycosyl hydrolases family 2, TIM barrel domain
MKWNWPLGTGVVWIFFVQPIFAQPARPSPTPLMMTRWGKAIAPENVLQKYPRPTMEREEWLNLNGIWDYGVTHSDKADDSIFNSKILVPFPVESVLSGIKHLVTDRERLWYRREFEIPAGWRDKRILLNFEAVNWEARVWVNGREMGIHRGGYDRFSFDITDALKQVGTQELLISIFDPVDAGYQPRGKQQQHPRDIFYTASSGIWQTVWLEPVAQTSIESLKLVPDIDAELLKVSVIGRGETNGLSAEVTAWDGTNEVGRAAGQIGDKIRVPVRNPKLWSPDSPFLYDLKVTLLRDGKKLDEVSSYFGMRQIAVAKDESGFPRLMLNHRRVFELGPLDQGYWPDGLYTAPSDDALRSDIEEMKRLGFNMCRKHVKIEPERWYYWCDQLGLMVWQDMPSGDKPASSQHPEIQRLPESAKEFETELKEMIIERGNNPSIVVWIPFNQGWGQYDTVRITHLVKELDPSRLVIDASGWFDMGVGDVRSLHKYFGTAMPEYDGKRACVIGECGAFGLGIPGHMWRPGISNWNLTKFDTREALTDGYETLMAKIENLEESRGLSGAVITEWSDVETSCDGFVTYDRDEVKMPEARISAANKKVLEATVQTAK